MKGFVRFKGCRSGLWSRLPMTKGTKEGSRQGGVRVTAANDETGGQGVG